MSRTVQVVNGSSVVYAVAMDLTGHQPATALAEGFAARVPLLVNALATEIAARAEPALAELGLTGRTYMALAVLQDDRPGSQLELSRLLGCVAAVVVQIADDLEAAGFAERTRDPTDRRRSMLAITPAGRDALERGDEMARQVEDELLGHATAAERERLHEVLRDALRPQPAGVTT